MLYPPSPPFKGRHRRRKEITFVWPNNGDLAHNSERLTNSLDDKVEDENSVKINLCTTTLDVFKAIEICE